MKRMPSLAYSMARLRVTVFSPPFVIIDTEAFTPETGWSASDAEMVTTLPDFWVSICLTASWVMWRNPRRLVETRSWKSSAVKSVKGLVRKIPALFTRTSMVPKCSIAASTALAAAPRVPMSPSTVMRPGEAVND